MTSEHELAVIPVAQRPVVTGETVQTIMTLAPIVEAARMYGITKDQAAIVMLTAYELGFGFTPALNGLIYTIDHPKGKRAALSGLAMSALIHKSGILAELKITDIASSTGLPIACKVYMRRHSGAEYEASFTMEEADRIQEADIASGKKTGLTDKYNWQAYPKDMLYHRALTRCARRVCPDVIAGMYTADELGYDTDREGVPLEITAEGDVVEGISRAVEIATDAVSTATTANTQTVATPPPTPPSPTPPAPTTTPASEPPLVDKVDLDINDLITAGFSPTDIVDANNGTIPATPDECRKALKVLMEAVTGDGGSDG